MLKQQDPLAQVECALADLQSVLVGRAVADPNLANADQRFAAAQRAPSPTDDQDVAADEAEQSEAQQRLDAANGRALRQREAERFDQSLKVAIGATEQLRAALDNFIAAIAPLGASGITTAAAAADFREMMRDSAAEVLDLGAQHKREILMSIVPQPTADAEQAQQQSILAF